MVFFMNMKKQQYDIKIQFCNNEYGYIMERFGKSSLTNVQTTIDHF
jgi:hypothetical protein